MSERVVVHEGPNVFAEHAEKWDSLLERAGNPTFFLRADWLNCWAKHWAGSRKILLAVVERNGEWIGGLPLVLGKGRIGARWKVQKLEFAGVPFYDRMELPAATAEDCQQSLKLLLQWMQKDLAGWTALGLHEVPNGSETLNAFKALSPKMGFDLHTVLASKAPMVDLKTGGKTSSKYRRQLRQSMEQLEERGKVETDFFSVELQNIDSLIQECSAVEATSWKGDQGVGIFRDDSYRSFMKDVWKMLAPEKGIALATIRLDGELIIYHWGFRHGDHFLSYNMAQRPETNNVRGGSLILKLMVDQGE
ncbi:MAG: GNAT family N-acetyltransferase, partial [Planctomycetota bacterium]|nr:GNAT family N-acetyltransferase [Planctomycetota bacterium]